MKEYNYYIFDFDGTLVDSSEGIYNSIIYALKDFGIEENDREKLRYFIGPPLFHSFKHIYGVSDEDSNRLVAKYRERYKVKGCEESVAYDGVAEMLKHLKEKGKKIAIASSKPQHFVDEISKHLGLYDYYDFVSAESFDKTHSSKEELINTVLEHFGNPPKEECLMIGDRFYDIDGAKATGLDSAGAVYGLGEVEELTDAGATYLLYNTTDILNF
ncbi:MAG: HAD-IA family hydrolase [Clostridia bacterium]|nr:HAD-IA family hydrolase [Clostridia bacterium]